VAQYWPLGHEPQLRVPPQWSGAVPQTNPSDWQVVGVQPHLPMTPPPPQMSGAVQLPQWT
jgi:hypothetical protein